jgi:hypothetical protein
MARHRNPLHGYKLTDGTVIDNEFTERNPDDLSWCDNCGDQRRIGDLLIRAGFDFVDRKCADECFSGKKRQRIEREIGGAR